MARNINDIIKNLAARRRRKIEKRAAKLIGLNRKRKANRRTSCGD